MRSSLGRRGSLTETARIARATLRMNVLARRIGGQHSAGQHAGEPPQAGLLDAARALPRCGAVFASESRCRRAFARRSGPSWSTRRRHCWLVAGRHSGRQRRGAGSRFGRAASWLDHGRLIGESKPFARRPASQAMPRSEHAEGCASVGKLRMRVSRGEVTFQLRPTAKRQIRRRTLARSRCSTPTPLLRQADTQGVSVWAAHHLVALAARPRSRCA